MSFYMDKAEAARTVKKIVDLHGRDMVEDVLCPREMNEPILDPANHQFTAFPIKYPGLRNLYKTQLACIWTAEEIDFSNDYADFQTMTSDERHFIELVLSFFAASDGIVNFNIGTRFLQDVQIVEAQVNYRYQMMMEDIHSEVYSLMLDNLIKDQQRKDELFNGIKTIDSIKMMSDWALKWVGSDKPFAYRLIAFAIVEGVFFSGAFAAIFWIKDNLNHRNAQARGHLFMNGLVSSNKLIARDEGLHCQFA